MIQIRFHKTPPEFVPAESIQGTIVWSDLADTTKQLDIRLIWYTDGKGDRDTETVASQNVQLNSESGEQTFEFSAPSRPYSFSGKLISLTWAVEVVMLPSRDAESQRLTLSRDGQEIQLSQSLGDPDKVSWGKS